MARAFIVRPFGTKNGIDFEDVQKNLIAPALAACDIQGGTTAPFLQAGNIRTDMFQQLLVADLVVADISIHNANVFYELGIRHALQAKRTVLLRAKVKKDPSLRDAKDEVPFDLRTDRYLEYDANAPRDSLALLTEALRQTLASENPDSPVFQMLPDLEAQDRSRFLPVPQAFREDVGLASARSQLGLLGLLALEARDFFWASEGLRLVGRAQFDLKAYRTAKQTWEELYTLNPQDSEANLRLGTINQRLGDLDASEQALLRVVNSKSASHAELAEAYSLLGRNIKDRWRSSWQALTGAAAARKALESPELLQAYQKYLRGYQENLDSFYPGLNALSLLVLAVGLAKTMPEIWEARFDTEAQANAALEILELQRARLTGAVGISLEVARQRLEQNNKVDRWVDISAADFLFLTIDRPQKVAFAYQTALTGAQEFYSDSARKQLETFLQLGVKAEIAARALEVVSPNTEPREPTVPLDRVILFTGHMIDAPGTEPPRLPESLRENARQAILEKVRQEVDRTAGTIIALASGANGGDLLFHDVCEELGITHHILLPLPPDRFRNESVSPAGRWWEDRFDHLLKKGPPPQCLTESADLPLWLLARMNYSTWQRANLWILQEAIAFDASHLTLIALWDGIKTEGLGGTYHMRAIAQECGAALVTIYTSDLLTAT